MQKNSRLYLAEAIAHSWNRAGLSYSVVHGLHGYPDEIGRDLDILIERSNVDQAIAVAIAEAKKHGFEASLFRWSHWGLYQLALIDEESNTSLPLDLMCTIDIWRAKWIQFVDQELLEKLVVGDDNIGPFRVSHEGVFLKACIRPLLCGDLSRFGKEFPLPIEFPKLMSNRVLDNVLGEFGISLLKKKSVAALKQEFPDAMHRLQWNWIKTNPWAALKSLVLALWRRIRSYLFNPADLIIVKSPKPSETEENIRGLFPELLQVFIEVRIVPVSSSFLLKKWHMFWTWRPYPLSEFLVVVGVEKNSAKMGFSIKTSRKGGRWRFNPDFEIELAADLEKEEERTLLGEEIKIFLFKKYSTTINRKHLK